MIDDDLRGHVRALMKDLLQQIYDEPVSCKRKRTETLVEWARAEYPEDVLDLFEVYRKWKIEERIKN